MKTFTIAILASCLAIASAAPASGDPACAVAPGGEYPPFPIRGRLLTRSRQ